MSRTGSRQGSGTTAQGEVEAGLSSVHLWAVSLRFAVWGLGALLRAGRSESLGRALNRAISSDVPKPTPRRNVENMSDARRHDPSDRDHDALTPPETPSEGEAAQIGEERLDCEEWAQHDPGLPAGDDTDAQTDDTDARTNDGGDA